MSWRPILARTVSALAVGFATCNLLLTPISEYDDGILLTGSRLVGNGRYPYIDFYTHYGPLGFTAIRAGSAVVGDLCVALRCLEGLCLLGLAILLHFVFANANRANSYAEWVVGGLVIALSSLASEAYFLGFAAAAGSLLMCGMSWLSRGDRASLAWSIGSGIALSTAVLIRPAFGGYAAAGLAVVGVASRRRGRAYYWRAFCFVMLWVSCAAVVGLAVTALYPEISLAGLFRATLVVPARLMGPGGKRYLDPAFLGPVGERTWGGIAGGVANGLAICSMYVVWLSGARREGSRHRLGRAVVGVLIAGVLPVVLMWARRPDFVAMIIAGAYFGVAAAAVVIARGSLASAPRLQACAAFGLTAAGFGHYFWARADVSHLLPSLALALIGATFLTVFAWGRAPVLGPSLFVGLYCAGWMLPAMAQRNKGETGMHTRIAPFRCTAVREDAWKAVRLADSLADPGSRFVAVGSSQAWSSANPAELFLISSRLPYTRWFQYDPGLQDSPGIQVEMDRELVTSRSASAVIWNAANYLVDRDTPDLRAQSSFDKGFQRLYPCAVARFGDYEVRARSCVSAIDRR